VNKVHGRESTSMPLAKLPSVRGNRPAVARAASLPRLLANVGKGTC